MPSPKPAEALNRPGTGNQHRSAASRVFSGKFEKCLQGKCSGLRASLISPTGAGWPCRGASPLGQDAVRRGRAQASTLQKGRWLGLCRVWFTRLLAGWNHGQWRSWREVPSSLQRRDPALTLCCGLTLPQAAPRPVAPLLPHSHRCHTPPRPCGGQTASPDLPPAHSDMRPRGPTASA